MFAAASRVLSELRTTRPHLVPMDRPLTLGGRGQTGPCLGGGGSDGPALRAFPPTSTSCLGVVQVQLRAARNLCESWIEWWDEIQDLPREAARPEPRLEGLLWPPAPRPGTLPPYAPLVHTTCDDLARHHDSLHEADRATFRQLLYTAHYEAHAAGEAIGWPALQCLSLELGELAKRLQ